MSERIPKDIPFFKDFKSNKPIEIQTASGIVQLFPHDAFHGTGDETFCVTIHGICISKVEPISQCFVYYKGTECGGHFSMVNGLKGVWEVIFETIIPIPEYWGEF